jgi:hypothetical protein
MNKLVAKFTNAEGSKLTIFARNAKRGGVNVAASLKVPGEQAQTGCRSTVATETEGTEAFAALKASAIANGWAAIEKKDRDGSFSTIPMANPKPTEPAAEPKKKQSKAA